VNPIGGRIVGADSAHVIVSLRKAGLEIGRYDGDIYVEADGEKKTVHVTLFIEPIGVPQGYPTIQQGIDAAVERDVVLVSSGVYYENVTVHNKNRLNVLGAGAEETIIDGGAGGSTVTFENVCGDSVLDGFTIRNGTGDYHGHGSILGGGIFLEASSPKISNCVITGNTAHWGGGICVHGQCSPRIVDTVISHNEAESGGALFFYGGARPEVTRCSITSNTAFWYGGGAAAMEDSSLVFGNCLMAGNSAWYGGALYARDTASLAAVSCTIADNEAEEGGSIYMEASAFAEVCNTILWSNSTGSHFVGRKLVWHCNIEDDEFAGAHGNISERPRFFDPDGPDDNPKTYDDNNYHLSPDSPCIDAGDNSAFEPPGLDLDGNLRIPLGRALLTVDMGAYEYNSQPFTVRQRPLNGAGVQLIWNSQPNDTYTVWSCRDMRCRHWVEEATVHSQGEFTSWTDGDVTSVRKFYKIDMN